MLPSQLTGVGPLGTGEGQPLPIGMLPSQLTGVGPLGTGEGQPLPGIGNPGMSVALATRLGVAGGVETGRTPGSPASVTYWASTQHGVDGAAGMRTSR
jgi:hypothetical protein